MHKSVIDGIEIAIDNAEQIINMGGPWIGDLYIGPDFVSKDCVLDNFVLTENKQLLFFVKHHFFVTKKGWFGTSGFRYFTINFYNIDNKSSFEFKKEFSIIHIGNFISKNELEIYPAFHDQFKNKRIIINLDEEEFDQIS
jgi:hypothetical protein